MWEPVGHASLGLLFQDFLFNPWTDMESWRWQGTLPGEDLAMARPCSPPCSHRCVTSTHSTPLKLGPHPWDSPGKNTGVGCHFLLQNRPKCYPNFSNDKNILNCLLNVHIIIFPLKNLIGRSGFGLSDLYFCQAFWVSLLFKQVLELNESVI